MDTGMQTSDNDNVHPRSKGHKGNKWATNTGHKEWEGPTERQMSNAKDRSLEQLKFLKGRIRECACPGHEGKERAI